MAHFCGKLAQINQLKLLIVSKICDEISVDDYLVMTNFVVPSCVLFK